MQEDFSDSIARSLEFMRDSLIASHELSSGACCVSDFMRGTKLNTIIYSLA